MTNLKLVQELERLRYLFRGKCYGVMWFDGDRWECSFCGHFTYSDPREEKHHKPHDDFRELAARRIDALLGENPDA